METADDARQGRRLEGLAAHTDGHHAAIHDICCLLITPVLSALLMMLLLAL